MGIANADSLKPNHSNGGMSRRNFLIFGGLTVAAGVAGLRGLIQQEGPSSYTTPSSDTQAPPYSGTSPDAQQPLPIQLQPFETAMYEAISLDQNKFLKDQFTIGGDELISHLLANANGNSRLSEIPNNLSVAITESFTQMYGGYPELDTLINSAMNSYWSRYSEYKVQGFDNTTAAAEAYTDYLDELRQSDTKDIVEFSVNVARTLTENTLVDTDEFWEHMLEGPEARIRDRMYLYQDMMKLIEKGQLPQCKHWPGSSANGERKYYALIWENLKDKSVELGLSRNYTSIAWIFNSVRPGRSSPKGYSAGSGRGVQSLLDRVDQNAPNYQCFGEMHNVFKEILRIMNDFLNNGGGGPPAAPIG